MKAKSMRKRGLALLGLLLVPLMLTGCGQQASGRTLIREDGQTTVVLAETEGIFPKEGAALHKAVLEHYRGFDFVDGQTLLGYKFAETVFGDDRGLWFYDLSEGTFGKRLTFEPSPKAVRVSRDKSQLVVIPEETGGGRKLIQLNLTTLKQTVYQSPDRAFLWGFNWQFAGMGLTGFETSAGQLTVWRIDPGGELRAYEISKNPLAYVDTENLQSSSEDLFYTLTGEAQGLYRYSWVDKKSRLISPDHFIRLLRLSPNDKQLALVDFKNVHQRQSLSVYGLDGKKHYEVFEAMTIDQVLWQPDGRALVFTGQDESGVLSLYHANLTDGQLHFLGEYPAYSIESLAFSPDGSKLMVGYEDRQAKEPKWITHILTLSEGGTYNE